MKTLCSIIIMISMLAFVSGCLTRASAHTKKTIYADGRVEYVADTSIVGTGDKASQVAGEGMYADGAETDLGAGFKKGNASQQSTGIGDALTGLGSLLRGLAEFEKAKASGGVLSTPPLADSSIESSTSTAVASTALPAITEVTYSTDGYGGTPGAAGEGIYGRPSCGRCRAYHAAHPDTAIINLDDPGNRKAFWEALGRLKFTGTKVDLPVSITASGYTTAAK